MTLGQVCIRKEVPYSMRRSRGLWPKDHYPKKEEGKGIPEVKEIGVGGSGDYMSK